MTPTALEVQWFYYSRVKSAIVHSTYPTSGVLKIGTTAVLRDALITTFRLIFDKGTLIF